MKIIYLLLLLIFGNVIYAQTWTGATSTNWNTASNWSPATVPTLLSVVTIPNVTGLPNSPMLTSDINLNSLTMSPGSRLDINGFMITTTNCDFNSSILNNSSASTDIVVTLLGTATYFRGNTINDNITINYNGAGEFYDGYQASNIFNGNTIYYVGGPGTLAICFDHAGTYNGNVSVNRIVPGPTELFKTSATVTGNFSYTNTVGGSTTINVGSAVVTPVAGTINLNVSGPGNPTFTMNKLKNLVTGGIISLQNSGQVSMDSDTLSCSAININGIATGATSDVLRNAFTGNLNYSDAAGNTGSTYFRGNTINGSTLITINSNGALYESYQLANIYNGNTIFNLAGTNNAYICYDQKASFNGNLNITRSVAGTSYIFNASATNISGNFTYTNNAGGATQINQGGQLITIGGTMNISTNPPGNPGFSMLQMKNLTNGGLVNIQNCGAIQIVSDTLLLNALNITAFTSASDFNQNKFTATVSIADSSSNSGAIYFRKNTIVGTTNITQNGTGIFYEAYQGGNVYNGNTFYNLAGIGSTYICYDNRSTFNGNLSVNRTVAGTSYIFNQGANAINGNFSYTNNIGGSTGINQNAAASIPISGTINVTSNVATGHPTFYISKMVNQTGGGTISIQNPGQIQFSYDTLIVNTVTINNISSGSISDFLQNMITGNMTISDSTANASTYFRKNTIAGNLNYTQNSPSIFYESYQGSNTYLGNLTLNRNAGSISMSYDNSTYIDQDVTFNSAGGITFSQPAHFGGANNGTVRQLGTQPIQMPNLVMEKTGSGQLTLNDSVTVTVNATFNGGNIYTGANSNLIFTENTTHFNASATSHVIGPVTKIGDNVFTFPVGSPVSYNPVSISAPVGATTKFKAEYKYQNPTIDGFNTSLKAGTLTNVSNAAYWDVQRIIGSTNVTLTLAFGTNPYEQYPTLGLLKVAHWNGSQWDDLGNGGTTGTSASGTIVNAVPITSFSPFTIAGVTPTYFFTSSNPGPGPDGTPLKFGGAGGYPPYTVKLLPAGSFTSDSIFLVPNASTNSFRLKDNLGIQKDTSVTAPVAPTLYATANGNGTVNFKGWRYFVYMTDASNKIMGAIKDNDLTLGNVTMNTYFSSAAVATSANGNLYLKRSFRVQSQFAPVGTRRVRFYITKQEFNDLQAADPVSLPDINSLTITKYSGPSEDSLFNPIPGGNALIIPNSAITIADLGTLYSLDVNVTGFSGFYIGGNQSNLNLCPGSTISLPSNVSGATYQWQLDAGSGFNNITDGAVYSGTSSGSLTITSIPGSYYGYKYRCLVNGVSFSQVYTLKFAMIWQGTVSTAWENAANWSCGLPDANTDVIINAGKANYPVLNSNQSVRTLKLNPSTSVTVGSGFTLTVKK